MAMPFTQTLEGLAADSPRPVLALWAVAGIGLILWASWFATAHVTLTVTAESAQIAASDGVRQVAVPHAGVVTAMRVHPGDRVRAGDVLATLDPTDAELTVAAQRTTLDALNTRATQLGEEIAARIAAAADAGEAARAEVAVAQTKADANGAALGFARGRLARLEGLAGSGGTAAADVDRARADVAALTAQQQGAVSDVLRLGLSAKAAARRNAAEIDSLRAGAADLDAQLADARATLGMLERARDRLTLRAGADGLVGDVAPLGPGAYVTEGTVLVTLVPAGALAVTAEIDASALGAVVPGQRATVQREGGRGLLLLNATVARVAAMPVDGRVRVALTLDATPALADVQHGQDVRVEIDTGAVTPAELLARTLGWAAR